MIRDASWFYVFAGAVLVITGAMQLKLRPPQKGLARYTSVAFPVFCVIMGIVVVLYGLGYLPMPGKT